MGKYLLLHFSHVRNTVPVECLINSCLQSYMPMEREPWQKGKRKHVPLGLLTLGSLHVCVPLHDENGITSYQGFYPHRRKTLALP